MKKSTVRVPAVPALRLRWLLLLMVIAAAMVLGGCASLRVGSDFDPAAHFATYHSFTWMPREHHGSDNPLVVQRAHDSIEAELIRKGYVPATSADQADFTVDYTIGARDRMDVQSYPSTYVGYGWWDAPGWWGGAYWGNRVDVRQYREGTLSIDVFDARSHRPVWHGWAKKDLTRSDIERSAGPIQNAVAAVLDKFPPR
jgi:hypothetical protein